MCLQYFYVHFCCTCIYDFIIYYCSLLTDFPERRAGRLEWDYSEQGMNKLLLFQDITTTVVATFINMTIKQIAVFRTPHKLTHNLVHQKPTLSIFPFKVGGLVAVMKSSNWSKRTIFNEIEQLSISSLVWLGSAAALAQLRNSTEAQGVTMLS